MYCCTDLKTCYFNMYTCSPEAMHVEPWLFHDMAVDRDIPHLASMRCYLILSLNLPPSLLGFLVSCLHRLGATGAWYILGIGDD